ncbi:MAG: murein hydrolase activator EnvC family protein [Candidatus Limnocylindrales bacterium]
MTRHAAAQHYPRSGRPLRRRLVVALLIAPMVLGLFAAPAVAPGPVQGDELADAQAQQAALEKKIKAQKSLIAGLNSSQATLEGRIARTTDQLDGITDDLASTRKQVNALVKDIAAVQADYTTLVNDLQDLDLQLQRIGQMEATKKAELGERKAELAERIRDAWEAERTSLLETFLSGASFTDMLAEMSTQLDAAEQDRVLAQQIALDRETLLSLHQTVVATRAQTNTLRQETAVQKQKLDRRLDELEAARAKLVKLEKAVKAALTEQKAQFARLAADKAKLRKALAASAAAQKKLEAKIDDLVASQFNQGNIPSEYNGTLRWPMSGTISQDYGCTGFGWEPPSGNCAHFHSGIDLVAPYGTPVRASAAGRVVYIGWNWADGYDPAFIVIIAHSSNLTSWYAHLQQRYPIEAGQVVKAGQVIGYEGNTGHSTGAHLHWMVQFNGNFANPRLFT